ncbi:dynein axonemal assembly factor 10-like isoform X2 [Artemia franciscana]|uniref:Uncharacterized protein n=1 Tax=Artemia franciscana TaxID=6661 RepID=A0AA88HFW8_ARTSF|nr:hypothetical protein QYM36_014677 [Artemia franciscana]
MIVICSESLKFMPFHVTWIEHSPSLAVIGSSSDQKGTIQIFGANHGQLETHAKVFTESSFRSASVAPSSLGCRGISTGTFNGMLQIWDVDNLDEPIYTVKHAHVGTVNSICGKGSETTSPEIATGGRDGFVKLWDVRQAEQPVAVFRPAIGTVDCFTVTLGQTSYNDKIVAAGFDNGDIKIFDLRNMAVVKEVNITVGVCSMQFSEKSDSLLVTGINSRICYFPLDIANKESVIWESSWRKSTVWTGKLMPQSAAIFSTTAGDGSVGIWRVRQRSEDEEHFELLEEGVVTDQPITSFDWNSRRKGLAACTSFNETLKVIQFTKFD